MYLSFALGIAEFLCYIIHGMMGADCICLGYNAVNVNIQQKGLFITKLHKILIIMSYMYIVIECKLYLFGHQLDTHYYDYNHSLHTIEFKQQASLQLLL